MELEFNDDAINAILTDNYTCESRMLIKMEIVKKSLKLYALCIAGSIMCLVLTATMNLIGANIFGQQVGYNMQGTIEEDESEYKQLYTYFYDDGEDLQKAKYEADGYKLKEVPIKTPTVGWNVCAQICLFFMMGVFVFNNLWNIGFKDHNAVRIGTVKEDKFKCLKI